ncbi:signal peptide peptidase SppA [Jeotgalibacillus haloalkalitolerans]|uniref:Signal peptide peptidase SppA n=1 Tax=Jeotgalibacillus haloalkalitolerans TaxID=3104292 RepID=A0ABU5KMI1_9BACL|nr:signal peptide peptidase SppA [Jeotgalibacillus sp. HH7-29]MDZ5712476.1 signal peptide peptidase SppA [Jeotgalibacillus sp. HH7-29]
MNTKRWIALGIAGVLFIVSAGINFATAALSTNFDEMFASFETTGGLSEEVIESGSTTDRIAVIDLNGTIQDTGETGGLLGAAGYNHSHFMDQLNQVKEDGTIKGVVLSVNTPGGGVVESAQIHDKILEIQEAGKTVYVSMGAQATSGGYYVAAPADKIYASRETMTGSLGVILQSINFGELADNYGVEFVTVTSGEFKDMLNPAEEVREEDLEIVRSILNDSYDGFVDVIANGRDLPEDRVREIADGRIYNGVQALELDLIDEFGYEEDVISAIKTDLDMENASVIHYGMPNDLSSLLSLQVQKTFGGLEGQILSEVMSHTGGPRPMYLYAD